MNIFNKLKNFIGSIIKPQKRLTEGTKLDSSIVKINNFIDSLQKDTKNHLYKEEIIDEITKNPSIIDSLSYKRLVQLNQLCSEKINELELKIKNY